MPREKRQHSPTCASESHPRDVYVYCGRDDLTIEHEASTAKGTPICDRSYLHAKVLVYYWRILPRPS